MTGVDAAPKRDLYQSLIADIEREFPGFRVVRKDRSVLQWLIHYGLMCITLGGMRRYLHGYQTTIGWTVYVTPDWHQRDPVERYIIMRHERIHLRQFRRYTRIGMAVLYLFVPLPLGLAYFRARFEMQAYEETIRAAAEIHGIEYVGRGSYREDICRQFLGSSYGWMWPFSRRINAWYEGALNRVQKELDHG